MASAGVVASAGAVPPCGARVNAARFAPEATAARLSLNDVAVADQVKIDLTTAMKAGEKERVGALRLVLSELQKDAKEGAGDELAVLRRERMRRLVAATQFRDGGRVVLADKEEGEAELIATYLPAELSDGELDTIVADAVAETGAGSPKEMGQVMKVAMARVAGRADGTRVSARVKEALTA